MTLLKEPVVKEIYSIPTVDGKYRYVFTYNDGDLTAKGIPRGVTHKLIDSKTGGTRVGGRVFFSAPSWGHDDLVKRMLEEMRNVSSRMFFKTIARKPELWDSWKKNDYEALRSHCDRYVYVEEAIDGFFATVMKTERLRRTPEEGERHFVRVKCDEHIRGEFDGYDIGVTRTLEFFGAPGQEPSVNLTHEFRTKFVNINETDPGRITLKFKYPLHEWPALRKFFAEPRVTAMLRTWINEVWTDGQREKARIVAPVKE